MNKQVKGYASATSVNVGESIDLKVSVNRAQPVAIDVYRMGYYGGAGARLVSGIKGLSARPQPDCPVQEQTGLIECRWENLHTLKVPTAWTSGIYLALLTNEDGFQNYIQFVVRDDTGGSAVLYQSSVLTMQAYNNYPQDNDASCQGVPATGKNLYDSQSSAIPTLTGTGRAVKISFDRPYSCTGAPGLVDADWSHELYFIYWLERRGYDVSYSTNIDTHVHPERLRQHRTFLSVGHDEYWTSEMFTGVEAARDNGVSLGFFGSNDAYWQVRMEPSTAGSADRTVVAYKNTPNNSYSTLDPIADPARKTVRFQDPPVNRPSQSLLGVSFLGSTNRSTLNEDFTGAGPGWPWVEAGLSEKTVIPGIVGYEADAYSCAYAPPANQGMAIVGSSGFRDVGGLRNQSHAVVYRAQSGAVVFATGAMSWSWALAPKVDPRDPTRTKLLYSPAADAATVVILDTLTGKRPPPQLPSFVPDCTDNRIITFERGAVTGEDGVALSYGAVSLDSTSTITGQGSAHISGASSYLNQPLRSAEAATVDFNVRLDTAPQTTVRLGVFSSGPLDLGNLMITPSGSGYTLRLRNGSSPIGNPSAVLNVGSTYRVRLLQIAGSGTDGVLAAYVSPAGQEFGSPIAVSTATNLKVKTDRVRLGSTTNNLTTPPVLDADLDDLHIRGTTREQAGEVVIPPAAPVGLSADLTSASTSQLAWTDTSTNEIGFRVERSIDDQDWTLVATTATNTTRWSDTGLPARSTVRYRVRSLGELAASTPSNVVSVRTPAPPPPAPTGVSFTQSTGLLAWAQVPAASTGYEVQKATVRSFADGRIVATTPVGQTTWKDPSPEGVVWYRVRAMADGAASAWSEPVTGSRVAQMGFDAGTLTGEREADLATGPASVSTPGLIGAGSALFPAGSSSYLEKRFGPAQEFWTSVRLRLTAAGSSDVRLVQSLTGINSTAVTTGSLWVRANGTLLLRNYNTNVAIGPALQVGTTYQVTLHQVRVSDTQVRIEAFVAPVGTSSPTPFGSAVVTVPTADGTRALRWGNMANGNTLAMLLDDIKVDTAVRPVP